MRSSVLLVACLSLSVAACGDDGDEHHHGDSLECHGSEAAVDTVVDGTNMKVKFTAIPSPVDPELDLDFSVQILDATDSPVDGVTVVAEPWQPIHDHGVPVTAETTPVGTNGDYDIAKVHFLHPGRWELRFNLTNGADNETITTFVCVAGVPPAP